jgi:hypothetical protein
MTGVPDALIALAELYRQRHAVYGDSDQSFGRVVAALFPAGLEIRTVDDANRAALLFHVVDKLVRYAGNFERGGHGDSLDDISVYAQMLRDYDARIKGRS